MGRDLDWETSNPPGGREPDNGGENKGCAKLIITGVFIPVTIAVIGLVEYVHPWS